MNRITLTIVAATLAAIGIALAADEPQNREQSEQREQQARTAFLQRLVGEWSVVTYAVTDPEQDPYRFEGKENSRLLGGHWFVGEFTSEVEGVTINHILTVGYDTDKEKFVATYIDAMQTRMWLYAGALDDEGTTLTLKAEAPVMGDADQTTEFRVVIESKVADRKVVRSQALVPGGEEWFEFLRLEYQRKE